MTELQCLEGCIAGKRKKLCIIDLIAFKWEKLGIALGFEPAIIQACVRNHSTVQDCCSSMLHDWLSGEHQCEPVTWNTFLKALEDIRERVLNEDIKKVVPYSQISMGFD